MNFKEYEKLAARTARYPDIGKRFIYPALGLADEAGEVLGKIKKLFRDHKGRMTKEYKLSIKKELGDVLWYLAMLSRDLGLELDDVARANIEKLSSRDKRGKISGSGDDR